MGLPVPGARQVWKHHRFLPLADTELQSGEALPRKDAERFERLGEAGGHQQGQSANLRYRHFIPGFTRAAPRICRDLTHLLTDARRISNTDGN